ncbi:hypothetical protein RclHR1_25710002 [Rhizophagus clarus]|uniref:Protein kinase domain-containing protein n=1 Tax=Rhizophagus clarus TaxID=94130 RepID=A0A2Z6QWC3_9GLOM|nr:hypothetical protein RclHR1_02070005 [Rhizophagus clarus]GBB95597.1 hypothetical protein RclHR1_25710002 [Rhizophagus clarus]
MIASVNCLILGEASDNNFNVVVGEVYTNDDKIDVVFDQFIVSNFKELLFHEIKDLGVKMEPEIEFKEYFDNDKKKPKRRCLHIFIVPAIVAPTTDLERKRRAVQDVGGEVLRRLIKRPRLTIPEIGSLSEFLDRELPEDIKIPISQNEIDMLQSKNVTDLCSLDDLRVLFRVSDTESATDFCIRAIFTPILNDKIPPDDGTENSFIGLWDTCIRNLLEHLIPDGISIRNSSKFTSTRDDRPDYGLILNNVCPFRGEGKSSTSTEDPKSELGRKLVWTYDPAPYVLGYYTHGPQVTLVAICRPVEGYALPDVVDIVQSNLKFRSERVRHLLRIINLSCIINALQPVIGRRGIPEFRSVYRNGRMIEIRGTGVKKTYLFENIQTRVQKLVNLYEKLVRKEVPNIDHLDCYNKESGSVHLSPKGLQVVPSNQQELFEAITCVLEAIVVLHDGNDPIYHRDIRWDNIIRRYDDPSKWFLIDWDDATEYPSRPAMHLTTEEHAPEVFTRNHRDEVDIWSVGKLIKNASTWITNLSEKITEFGDLLLSQDSTKRPSAKEALKKFKKIKKFLKSKRDKIDISQN